MWLECRIERLYIYQSIYIWRLRLSGGNWKCNKFQPPAKVITGFLLNDAFSYYSCSQDINHDMLRKPTEPINTEVSSSTPKAETKASPHLLRLENYERLDVGSPAGSWEPVVFSFGWPISITRYINAKSLFHLQVFCDLMITIHYWWQKWHVHDFHGSYTNMI